MVVALVEADLDLLELLQTLRAVNIAKLLLIPEGLHRRQLTLRLRGHLLALGPRLAPAATSSFLALEQATSFDVSNLIRSACKVGLRLRVGRVQRPQRRVLLQKLLDLRRVLFLNEKLLQVVIVHFHLGALVAGVEAAVLDEVVGHCGGLQLVATRGAGQCRRMLGHAACLLGVVLLYLLDLFLCEFLKAASHLGRWKLG